MKAYKITEKMKWNKTQFIVAAETEKEAKKSFAGEIEEIEEICEVFPGCDGTDIPHFLKGNDEGPFFGDFILESGIVISDSIYHSKGRYLGNIDITRTNQLSKEDGRNPFSDWNFDLWIGSFWNSSNWQIITIERD